MKYIDEFRNADFAKAIVEEISNQAIPKRYYRLMEFCGGPYSYHSSLWSSKPFA